MTVQQLIDRLHELTKEDPHRLGYEVRYEYDAGYLFPLVGSVDIHDGRPWTGDGKPFLCMFE